MQKIEYEEVNDAEHAGEESRILARKVGVPAAARGTSATSAGGFSEIPDEILLKPKPLSVNKKCCCSSSVSRRSSSTKTILVTARLGRKQLPLRPQRVPSSRKPPPP